MLNRARAWWRRVFAFLRSSKRDRDLADELDAHVQLHIDDNLRIGMSPEEARRHAMLKLGGLESIKERVRDQRGLPSLDSLGHDVTYAIRVLRRTPGFAAIAIL